MTVALRVAATIGLAAFGFAAPALADEVIIHRDAPVVVEPAPPAATTTTIEKHSDADGCASKTVHREDDAGNSSTVSKTNCD